MKETAPYDELKARLKEIGTLESLLALLNWDQETMMPERAAPHRAEGMALLSRMIHERATAPRVGDLLDHCEADPALAGDPLESVNLRELRRDFERARCLPSSLVAEITETSSRALHVWRAARETNTFADFKPWLDRQLELNRQKARCYGIPDGGELYDALAEDYEPGMTAAGVERVFGPLREALVPLIRSAADRNGEEESWSPRLPIPKQREFNAFVAKQVGYDMAAGRLDESAHPFTSGIGPGDTRITTRYREDGFLDALSSTLHEAGHALYEQGLPKSERPGQPLGRSAGLGLHESQSRLWENQVGRSRAFWSWALPEATRFFGSPLDGADVVTVCRAANRVRPGFIRVESDEATYNLHVMLRFDLERAMLNEDLSVDDLPFAWNDRIRADLGLEVPDDSRGCLQDMHWAMGAFGYFPTYTLGTLYSAQFWEVVTHDVPDVDRRIARGDFAPLLDWLRDAIHRHGRAYTSPELCRKVCGSEIDHRPLVRYLEEKLDDLF